MSLKDGRVARRRGVRLSHNDEAAFALMTESRRSLRSKRCCCLEGKREPSVIRMRVQDGVQDVWQGASRRARDGGWNVGELVGFQTKVRQRLVLLEGGWFAATTTECHQQRSNKQQAATTGSTQARTACGESGV